MVNTAVVALVPDGTWRQRAWHHAVDLGHLGALTLVIYAGIRAWERLGRRRGWLVLSGVTLVVDALILAEDLGPRAAKLAASGGSRALWIGVMTVLFASNVPLAARVGAAMRRPVVRWLAVAAGLVVATLNHFVLVRLYPGVHLHVHLLAATLIGSALVGVSSPIALSRGQGRIGLAALAVLATASLVVRPPLGVLARILSRSGSVLAPFVARFQARLALDGTYEWTQAPPGDREPTEPPILPRDRAVVVLVGIDALRADLVADDRYRDALPNLHQMRASGVWFRDARTPAPATMVALTSLFTGRYFSELEWRPVPGVPAEWPNADPAPRFPELLSRHGVRTAAIHGLDWLSPDLGILGRVDDDLRLPRNEEETKRTFIGAARLVDATIKYLHDNPDRPVFVFMHWLEAHDPYDLGGTDGSSFDRYVREVAIADRELGRLRSALAAPDLAGRAALVVMADHGEAFVEHGSAYHGATLYEEMVRVPILVEAPGLAAREIDTPVTLLDLGPTVLDLFGAVTPAAFPHGRTLAPLLRGLDQKLDRPIVLDSGRHQRALVFDDGLKVIQDRRHGTLELFDLKVDPGERRNLVDEIPQEAAARLDVLRAFFAVYELRRPGYELPFRTP